MYIIFMKKITNSDIANYLNKQVSTVNSWKSRSPELLDLVKVGAFCKKNNITIEMIKTCIELKEMAKDKEDATE